MARKTRTTEVQTSENRQRAHQALTRGRRSAPTADAKLKSWGQCEGQSELFSRQDLRTDQGQD